MISEDSFNSVFYKIVNDKGAEVAFEHYYQNPKNLSCIKYFDKDFFEMNEDEQNIVMFVLSVLAKNLPNSNKTNVSLNDVPLLMVLLKTSHDEKTKERIEEKFTLMDKCRNSNELIEVFKSQMSQFITEMFDAYQFVKDLKQFNYDDFHVLKKWAFDFYK